MLRQIVCIKQVPGSSQVNVDPKTGVLIRESADSKMNPYDLYALETAFQIRQQQGGKITVLSMGPEQAAHTLMEAIYMGADDACLLSDRAFAGADVLATSYTLSQAIRLLPGFDLIICGKQTTDGDTAQIGGELATWLDIPYIGPVSAIQKIVPEGPKPYLTARLPLENLIQTVKLQMPCLLTVEKDIYTPRLPSYRRKLRFSKDMIRVMTLHDLPDQDSSHYGLDGSPTQVEKIYPPVHQTQHQLHQGSAQQVTARFLQQLETEKRLDHLRS